MGTQVLWPDHCVQGIEAEPSFTADLNLHPVQT